MPNFSGIWNATEQFQARAQNIWPRTPGAPTIGTATAGIANCASVTFTAPSCTGYPAGVTGYRVVSTPGCVTQTGASSPLVVTGLTSGTAYTFKAQATNATGYGALSAASNSITANLQTCATFTTPGTFTWVAPAGVTSVAVVAVGAGGSGSNPNPCIGPTGDFWSGGGLAWRNGISVTPGTSYTIQVGAAVANSIGGYSHGPSAGNTIAYGGGTAGGIFTGQGGGVGGARGNNGGGGAGGYTGTGGGAANGVAGAGGGGGSGGQGNVNNDFTCRQTYWGGGGGVGLYGQGSNGAGGSSGTVGGGGGGGSSGSNGGSTSAYLSPAGGGAYGGAGGSSVRQTNYFCCGYNTVVYYRGVGASGAVRIVWAGGSRGTPSFPSTNVGP